MRLISPIAGERLHKAAVLCTPGHYGSPKRTCPESQLFVSCCLPEFPTVVHGHALLLLPITLWAKSAICQPVIGPVRVLR